MGKALAAINLIVFLGGQGGGKGSWAQALGPFGPWTLHAASTRTQERVR